MYCYLAGPMDNAKDGGEGWRKAITPFLQKKGIFVLNPADKPLQNIPSEYAGRYDIQEMKQEGRYSEIRPKYGESIRGIDLRMCDLAGMLVVYLNSEISTCGTFEEVFSSNQSKKPIIIVCEQKKVNIQNWMFLALPHEMMFDSWNDAKNYITHIDEDEEVDTLKRWRFFDFARLIRETVKEHGEFV